MRYWILLWIAVFLSPASQAANWLRNCQSPGQDNNSLSPGEFACAIPVSATDDTGILDVQNCENIDIFYFDDVDGDTTAGGGTIQARSCPAPLNSSTDAVQDAACWIMENLTLDGNPATNTEAIYGISATWMKITQVSYATVTEPIRVIVRCNGPLQ